MQNAVVRDDTGRSQFALVAANPKRVHPTLFRSQQLEQLIGFIRSQNNDELLEIVNHNVEDSQYVIAGTKANLQILGNVLNEIVTKKLGLDKMKDVVQHQLEITKTALRHSGPSGISLSRGLATIPLPGIDVPFHSRILKNGVPMFRKVLMDRVKPSDIAPELYIGRYIPNVVAKVFSLDVKFLELVYEKTGSDIIKNLIDNYAEKIKDEQKV